MEVDNDDPQHHFSAKWLKEGDQVRVEIDQLGHIEHTIVAEQKRTVLE